MKPLFCLFFMILLPSLCLALASDQNKPITMRADQVELQQAKQLGLFKGHVEVDQGSSHLRSGSAIAYTDKHNKILKAVAIGTSKKQASFTTTQKPHEPALHAYADSITFYPQDNRIVLEGNATLHKGMNKFSAAIIKYDIKNQHVISQEDKQGNGRTTIIIHPQKKKQP